MILQIGDEVEVKALTTMQYVKLDGSRGAYLRQALKERIEPKKMFVVGSIRRPRGEYKGEKRSTSYFDNDDYESAELIITSTVKLIQCRPSMNEKIVDVAESDLVKVMR